MNQPTMQQMLSEFFEKQDVENVHRGLIKLTDDAALGRLALLPRAELAERAFLAGCFQRAVDDLYRAFVAEWGDDPNGWQIPRSIYRSLGDLMALYLSRLPAGHTSEDSVKENGKAHRKQGRTRRFGTK